MKEKVIIRYCILIYWTFFGALTVIDKIIPDVYPYWVGADFYTLFVKLFASLGLSDPIFATIALAGISSIEVLVFVCYLFSLYHLYEGEDKSSEHWFYRDVLFSVLLFSIFSIGDQVFGERNQLLEHGIFWLILIVSLVVFKYNIEADERSIRFSFTNDIKIAFLTGILLTVITSYSILNFSKSTYSNKSLPVQSEEVVQGVYKFYFPFLADKIVWEKTISVFEEKHPELKINYIYTGPDELNSKKKTHMLLYLFTEKKNTEN
jgi:hypothetical protein